jgi:molybdopterin-guanine dinucleotide biosynthesis protein A
VVQVQCFGPLATSVDPGPRTVRAATLRAAAAAVGLRLDGSAVAVVEEVGAATHSTSDPELPLLAGDIVAFLPSGEHC